ncbi:MAG: T9SS type A sorting domain-containing protein [Lewinellaceae bacterium]|nr:T9SS type A sorting domain-containing protein [Saprospiraceae bacterium]MCB9340109.1 T9SS type A sorting domain-containing protein [Lewinellaceae bacterium]
MLKDYLSKLFSVAVFLAGFSSLQAQYLQISSPASIAGDYPARPSIFFGPALTADISGDLILADDGDDTDVNGDGILGTASDGCQTLLNDMTGKIALIDRGECAFVLKAQEAQAAGAIAVIICNNDVANPDQIRGMAGDDMGTLSIPAAMVSYNNCSLIKAELANGTVSGTLLAPTAGEACATALTAVEGTNTAPEITGGSALLPDAVGALYYTFTPAADALMTVSSCGNGVDTRLSVYGGCDALTGTALAANDDCDAGNDDFGSEVSLIVTAGTEYIIFWDDAYETTSFDWTLTLSAIPDVLVTFNVDMKNETVAGDGVKVIINSVQEVNMTDDGDGTWSLSGTVPAGSVFDYRFANGSGNAEDNPDVDNCRTLSVGLNPVSTITYCYNSCFVCPPDVACPNWIDDDFENYSTGTLGDQDPNDAWTTWTFDPGGDDDGVISNTQANSGVNALEISEAGGDDVLMLLGDRTSGNFILKWKMYIPTGSAGYYNLQKQQNSPGATGGFATQVTFNAGGTGTMDAGVANAATFTFPHDTWFEVYQSFDLDNDWTRLWIDGQSVYEWPVSWQTFMTTGAKQLGAIDFFGNAGNLFWVDDVLFKQIEACPANALVCDGFDGYDLGSTGPQSPWWTTWDLMPGSATDGLVTNNQFLSCEQAMEISEAGGDDAILDFGLRTAGNYLLSWDMYVPTGFGAYYNIQKNLATLPNPAQTDFAIQVNMTPDGNVAMDAGTAAAFTFTYPHDQWFNVSHLIDLDNNLAFLFVDGVEVAAWPASWSIFSTAGAKQINGVDFFGNADNLYYVDNVLLQQLPSIPGNVCASANDIDGSFHQGQGTAVTTGIYDNTNYYATGLDPTDGIDCWSEPTGSGGNPTIDNSIWFSFEGDGQTYHIETVECNSTDPIDGGDTQMAIYSGADCSNLTPVACNDDIDAANNVYWSAFDLETEVGVSYQMMIDGFNFNGTALSDGEFCLEITQLTGAQIVPVIFEVDMSNETGVNPDEVYIAGDFNGWSNGPMTSIGNNKFRATISLEVGSVHEYKFKNGDSGWEDDPALVNCGVANGNRVYTVEATPTLQAFCFNTCDATCIAGATVDQAFANALSLSPNPAGDFVNINYNFESSTDLNVRLINTIGQIMTIRNYENVLTGTEKIDISTLPTGAYMVVFSNGETTFGKRLIVE